jgi:hypothetical protein
LQLLKSPFIYSEPANVSLRNFVGDNSAMEESQSQFHTGDRWSWRSESNETVSNVFTLLVGHSVLLTG